MSYASVISELTKLSYIDFNKVKKRIPLIEKSRTSESIKHCPYCKSTTILKNGTKNNIQNYKCKSCLRYFNTNAFNVTKGSNKFNTLLPELITMLIEKKSLRKISEELNIHLETAFNYRHKLLKMIEESLVKYVLSDEVQVDEMFYPINLKGTKPKNMPRMSKIRKTPTVSRKELVCIETGIDTKKDLILEIAGTSTISIDRFETVFNGFIDQSSMFIGDSAQAYRTFVKRNELNHSFVPTKKHKSKDGYSLASVNQKHSDFKIFMKPYLGVSTRHLSKYIALYRFLYENNNFNNLIELAKTTKKTIKTKEICNTPMPVDINTIYESDLIRMKYDAKWYRYKH